MASQIHVKDILQEESDKIGSQLVWRAVDLGPDNDVNFYARVENESRCIFATRQKDCLFSITLRAWRFFVCNYQSNNLSEIIVIADKWVCKKVSIWRLIEEHTGIIISEKGMDLMTLSNETLLKNQWINTLNWVKKHPSFFRADVLNVLMIEFHDLYAFFSHRYLRFTNVIGLGFDDEFSSAVICCREGNIYVSDVHDIDFSLHDTYFCTTDVNEAIHKAKELFPKDYKPAFNPLKS